MATPELIIFDCDGVLIDSEILAFKVLMASLADCGIDLTLEEAMERYAGISEAAEKDDLHARYPKKIPGDFFEKKKARRRELFKESLKAMQGISELVDALTCKKCVASGSAPDQLDYSLKLVGLWDRFAPNVFSATQVEHGKPAPDLFLFAARQMGVAPANCLVIEDSILGVRAAKAAEMRVYGFVGGSHWKIEHGEKLLREGANAVFARMSDLQEALHGL
jgi:HAD superfamily hydrolase (TIGR01509 family)